MPNEERKFDSCEGFLNEVQCADKHFIVIAIDAQCVYCITAIRERKNQLMGPIYRIYPIDFSSTNLRGGSPPPKNLERSMAVLAHLESGSASVVWSFMPHTGSGVAGRGSRGPDPPELPSESMRNVQIR